MSRLILDVISTEEHRDMEISSSIVQFPSNTPDRKTEGFLAVPKAPGKYPGVIVIHEIWGLVDHIKDVGMRLAREGYAALAVDLFEEKTLAKLEDGRKLREQFTEEKLLADLNGAHGYLKKLKDVNPKHIGVVGFCMGGGLSLLLACHNPEIAAAVVFYGRNPTPIDQVKNVKCPILGNYAGADIAITETDINLLKQTLAKYGKTFDIKTYEDAPHAFFNDTRESYRPEAAKDAWQRVLKFYGKYLKT
jgi:carboxymethylenebutenolidase